MTWNWLNRIQNPVKIKKNWKKLNLQIDIFHRRMYNVRCLVALFSYIQMTWISEFCMQADLRFGPANACLDWHACIEEDKQ